MTLSEHFRDNELYNIKRYINSFVYLLCFTLLLRRILFICVTVGEKLLVGVVIGALGVRVRVRVRVRDD